MLARAALALAFDHALQPEHDPRTDAGLGAQRFGKIEMAGDLQRRHLPGLGRPGPLVLNKCRYFLPKPAHLQNPVSTIPGLWGQGKGRGEISPKFFGAR